DALAEEVANPFLVPPPLRDERVAARSLERAPLAREHGRGVELRRDDPQVAAQREADPLGRGRARGQLVERRVERLRASAGDLPQEILLRLDVVVERG